MKTGLNLIAVAIIIFITVSWFDVADAKKLDGTNKYNVINVQGRIVIKKSGEDMKRGDVYVSGTHLNFITNKSRAAIVNKSKGRFVLTGSSKGKIKVLPAANNMSSRGGALLNVVDLKKHFSDRYLILKSSEVQIGKAAFPMGNKEFFYLTFDHEGEEIAKKLRYEDDFLIFDKNDIFMIDGESIPYEEKEMTLYYRKDGKGSKINTFTPVFADNEELIEEITILLASFESSTDSQKIKEITSYLNEFYGKPHKDNLLAWLKAEFNL